MPNHSALAAASPAKAAPRIAKYRFFALLFVACLSASVFQTADVKPAFAQVPIQMDYPVGPTVSGAGGSGVARDGDIAATFLNPALLSGAPSIGAYLSTFDTGGIDQTGLSAAFVFASRG